MARMRELLAERQAAVAKGNKLLDAEGNLLATATEEQWKAVTDEIAGIDAQMAEANRAAERRALLTGSSAVAMDVTNAGGIIVGANRATLDPTDGFANAAEFAKAVQNAIVKPHGGIDERLVLPRGPGATTGNYREGGSDGFLVPQEFRDRIWAVVHEEEDWASEVDAEETASNYVNDLVDESTPWGAAGVVAAWRSEAAAMTATKDQNQKPRGLGLDLRYCFVRASDEILEDAPRLNSRITVKAGEAIRWKLNDAIYGGNGVGQPLGFHTHAAQVSVAKETGQAADTVVALNVANMMSRMIPSSIPRSTWLIHSTVFPQIMTMTVANQPIWTPANAGFKEAPGGMLLGRPVRFSQMAAPVGDKGDIHLVDFKGYYALKKAGGVKFATSIHLYFDRGDNAFRWMFRFGGMPHMSAPVSPKNGTATLSHFVTLDARA
jgi:HK97 family phage major capsid protein